MSALRTRVTALSALLLLALSLPANGESWQETFDKTCSRSNEAMSLSVEELRALVESCNALEKVIEKQEPSVRKVYLKRLQLCKNLYAYMLEYRQNGEAGK
ncbi:hypothetical protein GPEL0_01r2951 [Geoanaerobacter pelophilus]|uniref:Secreted protein n=1 Tax=Geoanaerobacter pelophilus TaxID=60036 RepID=A0ABQ0MJG6_9BACT|nr:hypothetical protein [Geoanaerobacter pelophilus]GAW67234.1 hypothetical protein GPEL0_01r2951 [Geoanaerobacter pelophilus]